MPESIYKYDTFISYSHKDSEWVTKILLPTLDRWGVKYGIDFKDFEAGQSIVKEMEKVIVESRKVILVLTPQYTKSDFTQFEHQVGRKLDPEIARAKLLPILREDCDIPESLRDLVAVILVDPIEEDQWGRLYDCIIVKETPKRLPIGVEANVSRDISSTGGYSYRLDLLIGNPWDFPIYFDSISLRFHSSKLDQLGPIGLTEETITFTENKMCTEFFYGIERPPRQFEGERKSLPEKQKLEGHRGMQLPFLHTGAAPPSMPGEEPTCLSIQLMHKGVQVTESLFCALPPVLRLPFLFRPDDKGSFHINFIPSSYLPSKSGVASSKTTTTILETAYESASDALLTHIHPEFFTVHTFTKGGYRHTVQNWIYEFYSNVTRSRFQIYKDDPTFVVKGGENVDPPKLWMSLQILNNCKIDCDTAYLVAALSGGISQERGGVELKPHLVEGILRPIWTLPFMIKSAPLGILAETGEVVSSKNNCWEKVKGNLWNK